MLAREESSAVAHGPPGVTTHFCPPALGGSGGTGHEAAKGFLPTAPRLRGAAAPLPPKLMALAIALLLSGVLLPCWGEFALFKKGSTKAGSLVCSQRTCFTSLVALEANGARCSHHSECFSDCCLINLDSGGAFCAPRARITMTCLPQTRSAINITPLGPERLPSLAGGEGAVWEKEAGQAVSLHDTGVICFQKKGCKSRKGVRDQEKGLMTPA
ncbi:hypothetical protein R6Z07F_016582 [Ovis aries]